MPPDVIFVAPLFDNTVWTFETIKSARRQSYPDASIEFLIFDDSPEDVRPANEEVTVGMIFDEHWPHFENAAGF